MESQNDGTRGSEWRLPWAGRCLCGETRFEVTQPPVLSAACHCRGCQRLTASAYSLSLAIADAGFAVTAGEPVRGGLKGEHGQFFCPSCLSWLFTRPAGLPFVNVRSVMLENAGWAAPFAEVWTAEKLAWVSTPAEFSFAGNPTVDEFGPIIAAFAARGARPERVTSAGRAPSS